MFSISQPHPDPGPGKDAGTLPAWRVGPFKSNEYPEPLRDKAVVRLAEQAQVLEGRLASHDQRNSMIKVQRMRRVAAMLGFSIGVSALAVIPEVNSAANGDGNEAGGFRVWREVLRRSRSR